MIHKVKVGGAGSTPSWVTAQVHQRHRRQLVPPAINGTFDFRYPSSQAANSSTAQDSCLCTVPHVGERESVAGLVSTWCTEWAPDLINNVLHLSNCRTLLTRSGAKGQHARQSRKYQVQGMYRTAGRRVEESCRGLSTSGVQAKLDLVGALQLTSVVRDT